MSHVQNIADLNGVREHLLEPKTSRGKRIQESFAFHGLAAQEV
jgi:hypothetical protein